MTATNSMTHDPKQWLASAAQGDAQAWRLLVESYSPRIFGLIFKQCHDTHLAEEITQATFVQLVRHIKKYNEQGRFEPWLFRIAINKLRDEMRRRQRHATPMDMSPSETDSYASSQRIIGKNQADALDSNWAANPLEQLAKAEQIEQVKKAVMQLSSGDREILTLRHTADMTYAEIAETLNKPLGTVLAKAHRAVAKLKKLLVKPLDPSGNKP